MSGRWVEVEVADGAKMAAYLVVPSARRGPGIVLCQEIFGVNWAMEQAADRFAEEGYVVLAPDLFWRIGPRIALD